MRKLALLLLTAVPLLAQTAPSQAPAPTNPPAQTAAVQNAPYGLAALAAHTPDSESARKGRELLEKMITALGGKEYLGFQTMYQRGRSYLFYQGQPNSTGTEFWRYYKYPDKERIELTKQRDVIYIISGNDGYEITYKGTAAQEEEALAESLRRRAHSLEVVLREWLKDPKTLVFYEGPGTANQRLVERVSILNARNETATISIDPGNMLPVQRTYTFRNPDDNLKDVEGEIYANYRPIQGIMTPYSISRTKNGDVTQQRFINTVEYNVPVPDSKFLARVNYDPYKRSPKR